MSLKRLGLTRSAGVAGRRNTERSERSVGSIRPCTNETLVGCCSAQTRELSTPWVAFAM
jgi:hypothetical protein